MNMADYCPQAASLILAQTDRMSTVSERFQSDGTDISATQIVVFVVLAMVIAGVVGWAARLAALRDGRSYQSPKRLFRDLCRLHELDWSRRKLLQRLAKARQLEHPAQLFLEPTWFDAANLPAPLQPFRQQLAQLKQHLFQRPSPAAAGQPAHQAVSATPTRAN